MLKCIPTAALLCFTLLHAAPAESEDAAATAARLQRVDAATALDAPNVAPWHMKMSIQLFDDHGQPAEQGIIEEWWNGPQMDRITYSTPSYQATEIQNATGFYRTKAAEQPPWLLEQLRDQVVHPMPAARDTEGTLPEARKEKFGKATFECIMLDRPVKAKVYFPIGVFPTYCTDAGESLRAAYDYGAQLILRNEIDPFQGKQVAKDIAIARGSLSIATARVFKLEAKPADVATFQPNGDFGPADFDPIEHPLRVSAATMAATLISKVNPTYPQAAKTKNAAGTVIVQAVIARDGHVTFTRLVTTPDIDLGNAAMVAVKQWLYKPYLLDGKPVEVETTMIVSFSLT